MYSTDYNPYFRTPLFIGFSSPATQNAVLHVPGLAGYYCIFLQRLCWHHIALFAK